MATNMYCAKALTGGAAGALDLIAYADLSDQDMSLTIILTGAAAVLYVHAFDASSALAESSPDVIAPDDVAANNGRWILAGTTSAVVTADSLDGPVGGVTPAAGAFTTVNIDGGTIDDVEYVEAGGSTAGTDGYLKVTSVTDAAVFEIIADDDSPNCVFGTSTDNSVHVMVNNVRNATFAATYFRPAVNNQKSLGDASHLWTVVYATNGTIQTSTAKLKAGIKETPLGLDFVLALQPKEYRWADHEVPAEVDIKGATVKPAYIKKHTNKHHGFVAEDVAAAMQEKQVEFAGLATIDGEPSGLNYAEFIAPMVKAIQELEARIAALEKK